jgi:chromosome segregation ATPase
MKKVSLNSASKIQDINDNFNHLNDTIAGLNKKLRKLEDSYKDLLKINHSQASTIMRVCNLIDSIKTEYHQLQDKHTSLTSAVILIGEELELVEKVDEAQAG